MKNTQAIEHVKPNECNCQLSALRKLLELHVFSTAKGCHLYIISSLMPIIFISNLMPIYFLFLH